MYMHVVLQLELLIHVLSSRSCSVLYVSYVFKQRYTLILDYIFNYHMLRHIS